MLETVVIASYVLIHLGLPTTSRSVDTMNTNSMWMQLLSLRFSNSLVGTTGKGSWPLCSIARKNKLSNRKNKYTCNQKNLLDYEILMMKAQSGKLDPEEYVAWGRKE